MNSNNLFGNLTHYNTFVHRMDARLKLFIMIVLMVACFLPYGISNYIDNSENVISSSYYSNQFMVLGLVAVVILTLMAFAKVNILSFIKSMGAMWFMMIFLLVIMVFIPKTGDTRIYYVMHDFDNGYVIFWDGLLQCAQIFLRLILMIGLTMVLTTTTPPMQITYAFEWYLTPLRLFHFPTQVVSMILSLALRMIPTILDESQRIMKAQRSRGVDFERGFVASKIKSIVTLIVPLLVSCFARSEQLSLAMYARGYDPYAKRSKYRVLKFHFLDLLSLIGCLLIIALFITLCVLSQVYKINYIEQWFGISGAR
ncbi:MAG: energy-coupling factor transporter transmembrane protein EcfT [Erysipelotrichaceae bacterium]|nr:energy-coupling factor transporter transmembrane protein EcfT [Erysipelotrichaceae bacterium]